MPHKFEQSKQTTQAFQKSYANTASAGNLMGSQVKIKQEPIMEVGNRGESNRRSNKEPYKRRTWDAKSNTKSRADQKQCKRCRKSFGEEHLRNCTAMGKTCKNCNKPNHFARMCRPNKWAKHAKTATSQITLLECVKQINDYILDKLEKRKNKNTSPRQRGP